jgi:DNA-binding LacI/PurR family transcriptional regulator
VIGYDNISLSEYAYPPLTTLDIPRERIGRLAFAALVPQHEEIQPDGREYLIDPELVIRESTGAVPHLDLSERTNQHTTKNLIAASS